MMHAPFGVAGVDELLPTRTRGDRAGVASTTRVQPVLSVACRVRAQGDADVPPVGTADVMPNTDVVLCKH